MPTNFGWSYHLGSSGSLRCSFWLGTRGPTIWRLKDSCFKYIRLLPPLFSILNIQFLFPPFARLLNFIFLRDINLAAAPLWGRARSNSDPRFLVFFVVICCSVVPSVLVTLLLIVPYGVCRCSLCLGGPNYGRFDSRCLPQVLQRLPGESQIVFRLLQ